MALPFPAIIVALSEESPPGSQGISFGPSSACKKPLKLSGEVRDGPQNFFNSLQQTHCRVAFALAVGRKPHRRPKKPHNTNRSETNWKLNLQHFHKYLKQGFPSANLTLFSALSTHWFVSCFRLDASNQNSNASQNSLPICKRFFLWPCCLFSLSSNFPIFWFSSPCGARWL